MKKRILDLILKNTGLKITALVFAIILWFFVVSVNDPDNTRTMIVPVQVVNADVLEETNEYYVLSGKTTVTFQVTGKRSVLDKLTASSFSATADMNNLDRENSRIPIEIQTLSNASSVTLSTKSKYLDVTIGQKKDKKLVISGIAKGTPADGFAVADVDVAPNIIRINGPSDIINRVVTAAAYVDVEGMSSTISESVVVKLLDENGSEVESSFLDTNLTAVEVTADIKPIKSVAILVETKGELKEGLALGEITAEPDRVTVIGPSAVLNDLTEIVVPPSVIDLSTITKNFETTVDISAYLPSGVSLQNQKQSSIKIKVTVLDRVKKTFEIPAANFTFTNVEPGMKATLQESKLSVEISGLEADLEKLKASDITGSIDCSGLTEGSHKVNVKLNLNAEFTASTVTGDVMISPGTSADTSGQGSGGSANLDSSGNTDTSASSGTSQKNSGN